MMNVPAWPILSEIWKHIMLFVKSHVMIRASSLSSTAERDTKGEVEDKL